MWTYQAYVALQLAEERVREADNHRLAALARAGRPARRRLISRAPAAAFAFISSVAVSVARRLDGRVATEPDERLGRDRLPVPHSESQLIAR